MKNIFPLTLAVLAFAMVASVQQVSALSAPLYDVLPYAPDDHAFAMRLSGSLSKDWVFQPGTTGTLAIDPSGEAILSGRIVNTSDIHSGNGFDVMVQLVNMSSWADRGYTSLDDVKNPGFTTLADAQSWTFFDLGDSTLTGYGDYEGVSVSLTQRVGVDYVPQAGENGANDKDRDLGLSTWFSYTVDDSGYDGDIIWRNGNKGDINVDLAPVPEPTTLALLGCAAAGMAVARRRRS